MNTLIGLIFVYLCTPRVHTGPLPWDTGVVGGNNNPNFYWVTRWKTVNGKRIPYQVKQYTKLK